MITDGASNITATHASHVFSSKLRIITAAILSSGELGALVAHRAKARIKQG